MAKDLRKTGNVAGVLEPIGNGKKSISNELMKLETVRQRVSSDGQGAKIPHNYRGRPSFTSVSFLADEDERINANKSVLAKNPSRSILS